ncbi:flagellar hook protein FlgE [Escherichia coli]|nr:flagellar hook protein FlgE [Escherichia coli]
MQINLNSSDPLPSVNAFDASNADSYNKKGSVTVFDSQGNAHDMSVYFVKTGDNNWQVYTQDSSDPNSIAKIATTLEFNANGTLVDGAMANNIATGAINGADPATFSLSFLNSMQQNTGANNIVATTQNGYKPGDLVSYQINDDGTVVGNYSNEQTQLLGADCTGELCQQRRSGIRRRQRLVCDAIFWRGAVGDSRDGQLWHPDQRCVGSVQRRSQ